MEGVAVYERIGGKLHLLGAFRSWDLFRVWADSVDATVANPPSHWSALDGIKQRMVKAALNETGDNVTAAAKQLGVSRTSIYRVLSQKERMIGG